MTAIVPRISVSEGTANAELMPHALWEYTEPAVQVWTQRVVLQLSLTSPVRFPFPLVAEMRARLDETDRAAALGLAQSFAERVYEESGVGEVWFHHEGGQAVVTVVTQDFDLERDLRLQAAFLELERELQPKTASYLDVFAEVEGIPESVRTGGVRL